MLQLVWQCSLVAVGSAVGAVSRFLVTKSLLAVWPTYVGAGTLVVNVVGSLAIGTVMALVTSRPAVSDDWRLFWVPGFLGGLTTFSALSYETWEWTRGGSAWVGWLHLAGNVLLGLAAVGLGHAMISASLEARR